MCSPGTGGDKDVIRFEILEDGTVSLKTGSFSPEIHKSADDLLEALYSALGGERTVKHTKTHHLHVAKEVAKQEQQH